MQVEKIIDDIEAPGPLTRSKASHLSNFCGHYAFVSITEPTKVDGAFMEPEWIQAMQEELQSSTTSGNWSNDQILPSTISLAQSGSTATSKMKMALW